MGDAALREARYEDLFGLADNLIGEIINGMIYTQARPAPKHAQACSILGSELTSPFGRGRNGPGGWWILDEPELHLGKHVFVPDLAGWRRENMPMLPDTAWFELSPDWVAEVLSPATARKDRVLKMPLYAEFGVKHCWLIDPDARTLEAYANEGGRWVVLGAWADDAIVPIPPFEAVPFELAALWVD